MENKEKISPTWPQKPEKGQGYSVLFVNPPSVPYNRVVEALANKEVDLYQTVSMPMGILYLSSVLQMNRPGINIHVLDLAKEYNEYTTNDNRDEMTLDHFIQKCSDEKIPSDFVPDFIGISVLFSTAHHSTKHIAEVLKKRWNKTTIIVGGMHATNAVESLLSFPKIDFVCKGEGEIPIATFADICHNGGNPELIDGIVGRNKLAEKQKNKDYQISAAPLVYELDTIPFPAWDVINMEEYQNSGASKHNRNVNIESIEQDFVATIMTTRGCPFKCTFCASWTVHGREMRYRSNENVLEELTLLKEKYNVNSVVPEDDLFTVKKPRIISLCNAIADKFGKSIHFEFPNGLSVATLDVDVLKAMKRMGMELANVAVESGSPYVQKHIIKKNCDVNRARKVVQACQDLNLRVRVYFILGFPGETREQIQETIDFAASIPSDWNVFSIASPLIGTEMFDQLIERRDIDDSFNWDDAFFFTRNFDTKEIKAADLNDLSYKANININFFGNYNLRIGKYKKAILLWHDITQRYPGHLIAYYCKAIAYKELGDISNYEKNINTCRELIFDSKNDMAITQYKQFGEKLTEIGIKTTNLDSKSQDPSKVRDGMPNRARSRLGV